MFQVLKRDGSLQDFDATKISSAMLNAGASDSQVTEVLAMLETWYPSAVKENQISSLEIRGKVIEFLKEINPEAAQIFETFSK